jgi:hypothetical protein
MRLLGEYEVLIRRVVSVIESPCLRSGIIALEHNHQARGTDHKT